MKNRLTESEVRGVIRLWKKHNNQSKLQFLSKAEYPGIGCIIIENRIGNTTRKHGWEIAIAIIPHEVPIKDTTYYYSNKELPTDIRTALRIAYDIEFNTK